jgi:ABC-type polysaccharide/polyol phosphate transport system ATPase subunit
MSGAASIPSSPACRESAVTLKLLNSVTLHEGMKKKEIESKFDEIVAFAGGKKESRS